MTKAETLKLLALIKTAYPNFGGTGDPADIAALWFDMLGGLPGQTVAQAVRVHIQASRFPPTIADICTRCVETPRPGELWSEVQRLMNSGIAPDDERSAYRKMTPECKAAVLAVGGWRVLSMSEENDPYIRRAFLSAAEKVTQTVGLPHHEKQMIGGGA